MNETLSVTLIANASLYNAGFRAAEQSTRSFSQTDRNELQRAAASSRLFATQTAADLQKASQASRQGMQDIGRLSLLISGGLAIGVGVAIARFAQFDAKMSELGAVTRASSKDMKALSDAAIKAGQDTIFSASQAAEGETELAKAGVGIRDILGGGLTGVLNLAAAGHLSVAEAAGRRSRGRPAGPGGQCRPG
jgi:hypothetical protein